MSSREAFESTRTSWVITSELSIVQLSPLGTSTSRYVPGASTPLVHWTLPLLLTEAPENTFGSSPVQAPTPARRAAANRAGHSRRTCLMAAYLPWAPHPSQTCSPPAWRL